MKMCVFDLKLLAEFIENLACIKGEICISSEGVEIRMTGEVKRLNLKLYKIKVVDYWEIPSNMFQQCIKEHIKIQHKAMLKELKGYNHDNAE